MDANLQRRVQRYGWDLAAAAYDALWQAQLAPAHDALFASLRLAAGMRVLDVACGSGTIAFRCARAVGASGHVTGIDLSARMVDAATRRARALRLSNVDFVRGDAERLDVADASVDVAVCSLGLMYVPDPAKALAEALRVLRPGGRCVAAVWGRRARCGWSPMFRVVDAEVATDVCPLFFRLGERGALARALADVGFEGIRETRLDATLVHADADEACNAVFVAGPVSLAWSRFDDHVRARVRERYTAAIARWRRGRGYRIPAEFVVAAAERPVAGVTTNHRAAIASPNP